MTISEAFLFYACGMFAIGASATVLFANSMTQALAEKAERNGRFIGLGEGCSTR